MATFKKRTAVYVRLPSYHGERSPQCPFPMYAKHQKLQGFKCSEIIPGVSELHTAEFLGKPRAPLLRAVDRAAQPFSQFCQNIAVRFDFDEHLGGKLAQWFSGVMCTHRFEEFDRVHRTRQMVLEVALKRITPTEHSFSASETSIITAYLLKA